MRKFIKSIISAAAAAAVIITSVTLPKGGVDMDIYADKENISALPIGDDLEAAPIELTGGELDAIEDGVDADYAKVEAYDKAHPKLSVSPLTSIDHTSYIFYDQMSAAEKVLWDQLATYCDKLLCSTVNLTEKHTYNSPGKSYDGFTIYCYAVNIKYNGSAISKDRAKNIAELFVHCNPQYYFWYNAAFGTNSAGDPVFSLWAMNDCAKASDRKKYEERILEKTESWLDLIDSKESVYAKELAVCDIIKDNIEYDYGAYNKTDPYDWHDQTLLGAMYDELCVCAGYAQTFTYLCNAAGIDAFAVRKSGVHRWNRVNIYGTWYEVDTTWYDTSKGNKKWLNKSHSYILANDSNNSHVLTTTYYTGFVTLPDCVDDTVYVVGELEVTTLPKTEYYEGDRLNVSGGIVTATFTNGNKITDRLENCTVTGFDSSKAGKAEVTVKYEGASATYPINITALEVTGVKISSKPRTSYTLGDKLDLTGGKLLVTYNSGSTKTINMTADMVSGFDSSSEGERTLTVTYSGFTVTYGINVMKAPVILNGKAYTDVDTAFADAKNMTGDVEFVFSQSLTALKSVTLPKKASSITLTAASDGITLTLGKTASLTFACPVTIEDIVIKNSKGLAMPITAKKSLALIGTTAGNVKAADVAVIEDTTVNGNFTASGKAAAVVFTDSAVTGNLTAAGSLEMLGDCAVGGKLTPKGRFRAKGTLTVMK
ncbi:MAG: bacterial Ig-like domain-containing protein [Ruminiclostridium sp.]|nr:bacterial Ig-like domain-containing protein [Ruminiclostridium sp.]